MITTTMMTTMVKVMVKETETDTNVLTRRTLMCMLALIALLKMVGWPSKVVASAFRRSNRAPAEASTPLDAVLGQFGMRANGEDTD